jgi:hypothetical protein
MADAQDLRLQAAALVELERRKKDFPLYWFTPAPKVQSFIHSPARIRILSGGNRCGKSETGCAETAAFLLGYRPWVLREKGLPPPENPWERPANLPEEAITFTGAGIRVQLPCRALIVTGQGFKKGVAETLWPKFQKLLGPFIDKVHMAHAGTPADFSLKNGSVGVFASDEQDLKSFESTAYDVNHIDEPIRRGAFAGIQRGSVDRFARTHLTFTPIGPHAAWMFRDLYTTADGKRSSVCNLSIYDNPFLSPEAIAEFANDPTISEVEKQARLYGRFLQLVDRIYPQFNDEVHVLGSTWAPPRDWFQGQVIDPHSVRPWAIAYFTVNPRGDVIFFREWPASDFSKIRRDPKSFDDYAVLFKQLEGNRPPDIRLVDPNYGPRTDTLRGHQVGSVVSEMGMRGYGLEHHLNDDLEFGEARVRELLFFDATRPTDDLNRPKLYFTEACPNLIASMSFYTAKTNPDGDVVEGKRDETYKDFADLVRYMAVSPVAQYALSEYRAPAGDDPNPLVIGSYGEQ